MAGRTPARSRLAATPTLWPPEPGPRRAAPRQRAAARWPAPTIRYACQALAAFGHTQSARRAIPPIRPPKRSLTSILAALGAGVSTFCHVYNRTKMVVVDLPHALNAIARVALMTLRMTGA